MLVTFDEQTQQYKDEITKLEAEETELVHHVNDCVGSRPQGVVCGLAANEAPNPWLALNDVPCRGYATKQTREKDYCGYWDSDVNPNAADGNLKIELLRVGPYCHDANEAIVFCSANASRTQRAGVYDIEYMKRDDRVFCELQFSRERIAPEANFDIEECRRELEERIGACKLECDTCRAECTNSDAEGLVDTYRCSVGLPVLGMAAAFHTSDIGVDISGRWGAVRTKGRPPTPDTAYQEQYRTMVQNSVSAPIAPRNSISCRKSHRESTVGGYTPPLKDDGNHIERKGFMVECETDADCYSRCGEHPIHASPYVCTHNLTLYTFAGYDRSAAEAYHAAEQEALSNGEAHPKVIIDSRDKNFYTLDEPGDDKYDVENHSKGVCTDVHISYGSTGCNSVGGSKVMMGIVGCTGRMYGWATLFCGTLVTHGDSDFVTDIGISLQSLAFPRVLVPETEVNGKTELAISCSDPFDCKTKCDFFDRVSRDGGLPSPEACALCEPPCPDNIGTTFISFVHAFVADVATALRLAATCLGPGGLAACVCQIFMMLKPAWMDNLVSNAHSIIVTRNR